MNALLLTICLALIILQVALPMRWAFLPLLFAACHTPYETQIAGFTVARIVIVVGLLRAAMSGALEFDLHDSLDRWVIAFVGVALLSSLGHASLVSNPFVFRCGLVLNVLGTYLYARAFLTGSEALDQLGRGIVIVLVPFAILMMIEKQSGHSPYAAVGAQNTSSLVRDGKIRAQGPFGTPILGGTVGACAIPLLIPLWRTRRRIATTGLISCAIIAYSSASSGPISTALLGVGAIALWPLRSSIRQLWITTVLGMVAIHFVKERPVWYLMALMDFVGGSTGWHRAYLIDMGFKHLSEWWFLGTDHTGHWMPYSLPTAVPGIYQADLTNYYLHLGVIGGIPLVSCLVAIQWKAFKRVGRRVAELHSTGDAFEFSLWCVGATLFAHSVTFLSISYFDQMYVFFWMVVGALPTLLVASGNEDVTVSDLDLENNQILHGYPPRGGPLLEMAGSNVVPNNTVNEN